ncbi:MAG: hypothetical protein Q7K03_05970 [Dehalococcoidia bacterium]|nr:hypothetical protein [Dehalococcoidia bacterium]
MAMSTGEMVQRAKVRALSEGLQVYRIAPDAYVVPSKSEPGEAYEILIINGDPACPCPGFVNRQVCKHQQAVSMRYAIDIQEPNKSEE